MGRGLLVPEPVRKAKRRRYAAISAATTASRGRRHPRAQSRDQLFACSTACSRTWCSGEGPVRVQIPMKGHEGQMRTISKLIASVAMVAGAALAAAAPAQAITNGVPDGSGHPEVGALLAPRAYSDG